MWWEVGSICFQQNSVKGGLTHDFTQGVHINSWEGDEVSEPQFQIGEGCHEVVCLGEGVSEAVQMDMM